MAATGLATLNCETLATNLKQRTELLIERHRQGLEATNGLLNLALKELEVAQQQEEAHLSQRTAALQQRYAGQLAELERRFLLQAEALQQELANGVAQETARSQKALNSLADTLLAAVESAEVMPTKLLPSPPRLVGSPGKAAPPPSPLAGRAIAAYRPPTGERRVGSLGKSASPPEGRRATISISAFAGLSPPPTSQRAGPACPRSPRLPFPEPKGHPAADKEQAELARQDCLPRPVAAQAAAAATAQAGAGQKGAARSGGTDQNGVAGLQHESSSEYESYWCSEESQTFESGNGGLGSLCSSRPPSVKTVMPPGMTDLLRDSFKSPLASRPGTARPPTSPTSPQLARTNSGTPGSPLLRQYSPCMCTHARSVSRLFSDDD